MAPSTERFYREQSGSDLQVVTILADTTSIDDLEIWHKLTGVTFTVLQDEGNLISSEYMDDGGRPQFIVIDRDLTILYRGQGNQGHAEAVQLMEKLLAE